MKRRASISASQLAEMGFCEVKVRLKEQHGDQDTTESAARREEGKRQHERMHVAAMTHHNRPTADRRCFIATAVYGGEDPRTEQLRQFRDRVLMRTGAGRTLVRLYYWVSPFVALTAKSSPWLKTALKRMLDFIRSRIAPFDDKEDDNGNHDQAPIHPAPVRSPVDHLP